jgi:tetratricopeptide (TPR) repeat protein
MTHKTRTIALLALTAAIAPRAYVRAAPPPPEFDRALNDFDEGQRLRTDQPDRARQLFRSAAQRLESLAAGGVTNGYLEYNLGNCYLQAGDVGRAVLHYCRAQRLIPRDPLLADNLAVARSRCLLSIPPSRGVAVLRGAFFWHYETSLHNRTVIAVYGYVFFWLLLAARAVVQRRSLLVAAAIAGLAAAACGGSFAAQRWLDRNAPEAVVIASDVAVYKGPATTYQRQFEQPLQSGVEVTVRERRGGWSNIELADGKRGWIESDAVELVPPPDNADQSAVLPM